MKNILIAGAWPYANGLHIGHIAALLPGDVLARYYRAKSLAEGDSEDRVFYVSGSDKSKCADTLFNCVHIIANLAVLLRPFLPFSSEKVFSWLKVNRVWKQQYVPSGLNLPEIGILFERIDKSVVEEENKKLGI